MQQGKLQLRAKYFFPVKVYHTVYHECIPQQAPKKPVKSPSLEILLTQIALSNLMQVGPALSRVSD